MQFADKLADIERRYEELTRQMADPEVIGDADLYRKTTKTQSDLSEIVAKFRQWKQANENLQQARGMLQDTDPDLRAMATEEAERLEPELAAIEEELKVLLLPKDPNDDKNVVARNPRRHRRRRSLAVCGRDLPHVHALRRNAALAH